MSLQRTLALVKPDAVDKADEIVESAMQAGFTVLEVRLLTRSAAYCLPYPNIAAQWELFFLSHFAVIQTILFY